VQFVLDVIKLFLFLWGSMFKTMLAALILLVPIFLWLAAFGLSIYGLVLAFQASVILGIVALIIEPSPLVIGLVMFFGGVNLAEKVALALGLG
jgi:hypothetical protein